MNTKNIYRAIGCFLAPLIVSCSQTADQSKPNIVIILADDLGYGDLGCYGNEFNVSPVIDNMSDNGIKFTDFHSNGPVCSPTRAAMLSGKYQQKAGIEDVVHALKYRHTGMNQNTYTIARYLGNEGYRTGIVGKWHLGYDTIFSPLNFGFDYFKGYVSGNVDYHSHLDGTGVHDWQIQKKEYREKGYTTDLISSAAVDFIERNKDDAFFLYVAHESPHSPFQDRDDLPVRKEGGQLSNLVDTSGVKNTYRNMIKAMDEGIGQILECLEKNNISENTLVIFLSDNGATNVGSNHPYSGYKGSLWEGGHRIPAIAYWEGVIKAGENHNLLMTMDIFPTIIALTGNQKPDQYAFDGIDFSEQLTGTGSRQVSRTVFWRYRKSKAIRRDEWKILIEDGNNYLFNLALDPEESNNLINSEKRIAKDLIRELDQWEKDINSYEIRTK
ncbi:MAG: sulfatase-like hydrolase/transferase [Bacteroidales bacterium]|nr:sulfatase-like hydrolase/transferase [Bacteroidales bacterium]MCF8389177.1 sulfatase-like hydrolase/transferase [Bacteroidales bacterium]